MKKHIKRLAVSAALVFVCASVFGLWYYNTSLASANKNAMIEGEAIMVANAFAEVLEQESKMGRTNWNVTLGDLIGAHPNVPEIWGPLRYYDWADFRIAELKFDDNGNFMGRVRVNGSTGEGENLPTWMVDIDKNPKVGSSDGIARLD